MPKKRYVLLIALAVLTLALLTTSCTCSTGSQIPGGDWNPSGIGVRSSKIAYASDDNIYVMDANGGGQTKLTNNSDYYYDPPVWSPDGTKIIFIVRIEATPSEPLIAYDLSGVIYTINTDGSDNTALMAKYTDNVDIGGYWSNSNPVWSPDGKKIAFESIARESSELSENYDIWVMNTDGSHATRLTDNPAKDYSPTWSPDSSQIAFVSQRNGNAEIYVMNADGTNQTRITNNTANDTDPAWAP